MAIDKGLHPNLLKLQLDLEEWLKGSKPRRRYVPKLMAKGHKIETPRVKYTRKCKHKNKGGDF